MTNIVSHDYNGFAISQKQNGYVSLTDMAVASGKLVADYLRLDSTVEYLEALARDLNCSSKSLIIVVKGGKNQQGTWAHFKVFKHFEGWCKKSENKKSFLVSEHSIRNKIAKLLGGQIEVPCKTGFVDVLTDLEVIEVKKIKSWKAAVGQVLIYALEFDGKIPRIHLFGNASFEFKAMIVSFCNQLSINVSFE